MEIVIQILFVVSLLVTIYQAIKMVGAILGNRIAAPFLQKVWVGYPSVTFQIWFWSQSLFQYHG